MSARDEILGRVRAGVGKTDFPARRALAEAYMNAREQGPQPLLATALAERFKERAESLASSVDSIACREEAPAAVARFLVASGLGNEVVVTPEIAEIDWEGSALSVSSRGAEDSDRVGISSCFCAIAETGTLMLLSGPDAPATVSLLPETHIALIPVSRIVATMEDAFFLLRNERGALPRAVNFISGPSRTGDIEQTIVLGAHGPCRVHLILFEGQAAGMACPG